MELYGGPEETFPFFFISPVEEAKDHNGFE